MQHAGVRTCFRRKTLAAALAALMPVAATQVAAQVLEEVVVTSQKRASSLDVQQVPTAISVYGGDALEQFSVAADRHQLALHPAAYRGPVAVRGTRKRRRYRGHLGGHGDGDRTALDQLSDLPTPIRASLPDRWREMRTP